MRGRFWAEIYPSEKETMSKFEKYLEEIFLKECPETLDDDIEDGFDRWLQEKDIIEIIQYGNQFAEL